MNHRTDEIIDIIDNLQADDKKIKLITNLLWGLVNWTEASFSLYAKYRDQLQLSEANLHHVIKNIYKTKKIDAINLLFSELDRVIHKCSSEAGHSVSDIINWDFYDIFEKAIKTCPDLVIEEFTKRLKAIVELKKYEKENGFYRDKVFSQYERGETLYDIWKIMTIYVRELCDQIHKGNIKLADRVVSIIPEEMLSQEGKKSLKELERKFGKYKETPPEPIEATWVGPPLPDNAYEYMTLDKWLGYIQNKNV